MTCASRSGRAGRAALRLTVYSCGWLLCLWIAENVIGERNGLTAVLAYLPQHLFYVPVALSLLVSLFTKRFRLIGLNLALTLLFCSAFMGLNVSASGTSFRRGASTVMTWNVRSAPNLDRTFAVIQKASPNILMLQEIKAGNPLLGRLRGSGWHIARAADVAILSRSPITQTRSLPMLQGSGRRALMAETQLNGETISVVAVHFATNVSGASRHHPRAYLRGSAKSRSLQVRRLLEIAPRSKTIIAGDFNMPPRGVVYRRMARSYSDGFSAGSGFGYTYPARLPLLRVDHVFVSHDLSVAKCRTVRTLVSDHLPVVVEM